MPPRLRQLLLAAIAAVLTPSGAAAQQSAPSTPPHFSMRMPAGVRGPEVTVLPPGDDPAAVVGTDVEVAWRDDAPAGTIMLRWSDADRPGGVDEGELQVVSRTAGAWQPVPTTIATLAPGVVTLTAPPSGEYAVRWRPTARCSDAAYRLLDYRLGKWEYRAAGYDPGRDELLEDDSRCGLYDRYVDVTGGRSDAFLRYRADQHRWYETVYDPDGRTVMTGSAWADSAVFNHAPRPDLPYLEREVYRKRPQGGIAFAVERSTDQGKSWRPFVTAVYTRLREE